MPPYLNYLLKKRNDLINSAEFSVGDVVSDKKFPWTTGRITNIVAHFNEIHYEILVRCPGMAPRVIHLNEDGILAKFSLKRRARNH